MSSSYDKLAEAKAGTETTTDQLEKQPINDSLFKERCSRVLRIYLYIGAATILLAMIIYEIFITFYLPCTGSVSLPILIIYLVIFVILRSTIIYFFIKLIRSRIIYWCELWSIYIPVLIQEGFIFGFLILGPLINNEDDNDCQPKWTEQNILLASLHGLWIIVCIVQSSLICFYFS